MPADKRPRPRTIAQLQTGTPITGDPVTSRLLGDLGTAVQAQQVKRTSSVVKSDLVVGANQIVHGLGRVPLVALVTPSVADATFAYALTSADLRAATLTVVGIAQRGAAVRFE